MNYTTGTSVVGFVFDSGVILAADTTVTYMSMSKFRNETRVIKVNEYTVGGSTGDFPDFQYLSKLIEDLQIEEETSLDGDKYSLSPLALHTWLTRVLYNRRSKFQPLLTTWVIGGINESTGKPYLGYVDDIGTAYTDNIIATGYGGHIATPMLRSAVESRNGQLPNEAEARALIAQCMSNLYARDCRAFPRYNVAVVRKDAQGKVSSVIEQPVTHDTHWVHADLVKLGL